MAESKSAALPLGDSPSFAGEIILDFFQSVKGVEVGTDRNISDCYISD